MTENSFFVLFICLLIIGALYLALSSKQKKIKLLEVQIAGQAKRHREETSKLTIASNEATRDATAMQKEAERLQDYTLGLERIIHEKNQFFPWLATAHADFQQLIGEKEEFLLRLKSRPAPKAAVAVSAATLRAREAEKRFRTLKYRMDMYERYFPWITEVMGDSIEELLSENLESQPTSTDEAKDDPVRQHVSDAEYRHLRADARNQLALDRWTAKRKSKWEIGRMYERYIGYCYEQQGYRVDYFGATQGLDDLGRDLIAKGRGKTLVVQCKYWSKESKIHEKHIFQLFGSVVEMIARNNTNSETLPLFDRFSQFNDTEAIFVTSTKLSERAREFADILGVKVREEVPLCNYPLIKCNISKSTGSRLYHLPFDQQYDRTRIEQGTGEFYAETTQEAERYGFRRAYRWMPEA